MYRCVCSIWSNDGEHLSVSLSVHQPAKLDLAIKLSDVNLCREKLFIFCIHNSWVGQFQMTQSLITLWPWLWPLMTLPEILCFTNTHCLFQWSFLRSNQTQGLGKSSQLTRRMTHKRMTKKTWSLGSILR